MRFSLLKHSSPILLSTLAILAGQAVQAQTLIITGGQGQLVTNASVALQPLTVQLLDATGKPFPNQIVNFIENSNGVNGAINGSAAPTDVNGMTSVQFRGPNLAQANTNGLNYVQTTVTASFGSTAVLFTETTSATSVNGNGGGSLVQPVLVTPVQGQVLSGPAGSTSPIPIRVFVGSQTSVAGIPNISVAVVLDPTNVNSTGTISCKEGLFVLTDATGFATCTPVFGKTGTGTFTVTVGGQFQFTLNQFSVTVGPPGLITVTSGDGQTGMPGQLLALPIVALVQDLAGNNLTGAQVVFESITPGGVIFQNTRTTSDANGRVSTSVVLGNVAGPVQIRIRDAANQIASPAIVTETVLISVTGLTIVSGSGQTAFVNAAFGLPLIVRVTNANSQPVANSTVTFAVTSGSATVSPATVLTDGNGNATANVTAGPNAGPITISATTGNLTQTFTLTSNPPGPVNFSYFNGASFAPNQISPGAIVTINAQGLVSGNVQGVVGGTLIGVLPFTVAGVSVTINNIPAPIFYVANQNGQQSVTVQIPFEVPATTVPITIATTGGGSTSAFVTVLPVAPGLFESTGTDIRKRVVALRPNGTVISSANPAVRGENIRFYMTGIGPVSPAVPTGSFSPAASDPIVTSSLVVGIANNGVPLVQAIYARNLIGVYEVTVTVPTDTVAFPSGTVAFVVAVQGPNGLVYSQTSAISIQ